MTFTQFPMPRELVLTSGNTKVGIMPDISLVSHFQVGNTCALSGSRNRERQTLGMVR